ncbi:MAG: DNA repair protein RecN [Chloroflexota bacterium]
MILELTIRDFAIIDLVRISFSPGFNVMTGETGAGKSIIIDAVGALLGGRAGVEFIRSGAKSSSVEGVFLLPADDAEVCEPLRTVLEEYGLEAEDGSLILSREMSASGRSVARVNGRAVPVSVLQQVGRALVDIHGQSEHLSLLRVGRHLDFLDSYGDLLDLRREVAERVESLRRVRRQIEDLVRDERELARRVDLLTFQVNEIDSANLHSGEEAELETERLLLVNAEKLKRAAEMAYQALYEGEEPQRSVLDLFDDVVASVVSLAKLDASVAEQQRILDEVRYQLDDVACFLRGYRERIDRDPARLEAVEERLSLIRNLKRKYGASVDEVLHFRDKARAELESISSGEERLADLRAEETRLLEGLALVCERLSDARHDVAGKLSRAVEEELASLAMEKSRFAVRIERKVSDKGITLSDGQRCDFDATGIDSVEFMLSPNPGEPIKPLAKIASGGEISRVMLALKTVLAQADPVPTLIFDEIDSGIGGRTAPIIGRKLWNLSRSHQVICVTHLPQIAAVADGHMTITKTVKGERTATSVQALTEEGRVEEIAAMLGGATSDVARENARELLWAAKRWKEDHGASTDKES